MKIILFSLFASVLIIGIIPSINAESVPDWVKNTAGWWATDVISETEFVNAIEFLVKDGIIEIESKSKCMNDILNYFGNKEKIIGVCKDHESSSSLELIPYDIKLKFNSEAASIHELQTLFLSPTHVTFLFSIVSLCSIKVKISARI